MLFVKSSESSKAGQPAPGETIQSAICIPQNNRGYTSSTSLNVCMDGKCKYLSHTGSQDPSLFQTVNRCMQM